MFCQLIAPGNFIPDKVDEVAQKLILQKYLAIQYWSITHNAPCEWQKVCVL